MTDLFAFGLSLVYTGLGYALIAWKYQHFSRLGPRERRVLVALHIWVVASNVALFTGWVVFEHRSLSWHPFPMAGLGLALAGTMLVLWALSHLRHATFIPFTARPVDGGPYGWVRHPVYAGGILATAGLAYFSGSTLVLFYAVVVSGLLYWVSKAEEIELIGRYGEAYLLYADRRGRFLPRWKPATMRRKTSI